MKKFDIPCDFGSRRVKIAIYVGNPKSDSHPIHFQANWLAKERGGTIPEEIMNSLEKLQKLAEKNAVPFEELCAYAIEAASAPTSELDDKEKKE